MHQESPITIVFSSLFSDALEQYLPILIDFPPLL
jgi:hypothetical protein